MAGLICQLNVEHLHPIPLAHHHVQGVVTGSLHLDQHLPRGWVKRGGGGPHHGQAGGANEWGEQVDWRRWWDNDTSLGLVLYLVLKDIVLLPQLDLLLPLAVAELGLLLGSSLVSSCLYLNFVRVQPTDIKEPVLLWPELPHPISLCHSTSNCPCLVFNYFSQVWNIGI